MRYLAAAVVVLAIVGTPVAAAELDPSRLVLQQADVPTGFRLDAKKTGVRTNASEAKGRARLTELFARTGRTTGYESQFDKDDFTIGSRADVFRTASGARSFFSWYVAEMRKAGLQGLVRARLRIGAGGWQYTSPHAAVFALYLWRHERVFAALVVTGLSRERAIGLARQQQRRIAAAIR